MIRFLNYFYRKLNHVLSHLHNLSRSKCSTTTRLHWWVETSWENCWTFSGELPAPHKMSTIPPFSLLITSGGIRLRDIDIFSTWNWFYVNKWETWDSDTDTDSDLRSSNPRMWNVHVMGLKWVDLWRQSGKAAYYLS